MEAISVMSPPNHSVGHVLYVNGPLGGPTNTRVRHQIASLLRSGERHIVLDLKQVTSLDAAGVGELVRAHNMARAAGATVQLVNPRAHVRQLIERVGLGDVLLADLATLK